MKTLQEISKEIAACKECQRNKSGLPVAGEGNPHARILFIGEAPGAQEAKTGRPFVGRSGKFLNKLLESIGSGREDVFITSPVKYFPGSRALTEKEIVHGKMHTLEQVEAIKPRIIVLLGSVAHKALVGNIKVTETHGTVVKNNSIIYFSTFHPAAALRFGFTREKIREDFKKLRVLIKKELN